MNEIASDSKESGPTTARPERKAGDLFRGVRRWIAPSVLAGAVIADHTGPLPAEWDSWIEYIEVASSGSFALQATYGAIRHTVKWVAPHGKVEISWTSDPSGKA